MLPVDYLIQRRSCPSLKEPGPTASQLELLLKAAQRAADHGRLRPWRFIVLEGEGRESLARVFAKVVSEGNAGETAQKMAEKARAKAYRAPTIITVISSPVPHPKIPQHEQEHSAAAVCQNIVNAAFMLGLGAIWRTGPVATHAYTHEVFGLEENERVVGFIYVGQPVAMPPAVSFDHWEKKVDYWRTDKSK